jgi:hypothetical protein
MTFDIIEVTGLLRNILKHSRHRFLKYLLDHHNSVSHVPAIWMADVIFKMEDTEFPQNSIVHKCFHTLLNHRNMKLNEKMELDTILKVASHVDDYATLELLKKGASLGTRDATGRMMIHYLNVDVLKKFFDTCITVCKPADLSGSDYFIVIDYSFLELPDELSLIEYIATTNELQPLVTHPVIASFLFLKWLQLSNICIWNQLLFCVKLASFYVYIAFFYMVPEQSRSNYNEEFPVTWLLCVFSFYVGQV